MWLMWMVIGIAIGVAAGVMVVFTWALCKAASLEDAERRRKKNNGDRIRRMDNRQLAAMVQCPYESSYGICKDLGEFDDCETCTLQWLNEETGEP